MPRLHSRIGPRADGSFFGVAAAAGIVCCCRPPVIAAMSDWNCSVLKFILNSVVDLRQKRKGLAYDDESFSKIMMYLLSPVLCWQCFV